MSVGTSLKCKLKYNAIDNKKSPLLAPTPTFWKHFLKLVPYPLSIPVPVSKPQSAKDSNFQWDLQQNGRVMISGWAFCNTSMFLRFFKSHFYWYNICVDSRKVQVWSFKTSQHLTPYRYIYRAKHSHPPPAHGDRLTNPCPWSLGLLNLEDRSEDFFVIFRFHIWLCGSVRRAMVYITI